MSLLWLGASVCGVAFIVFCLGVLHVLDLGSKGRHRAGSETPDNGDAEA